MKAIRLFIPLVALLLALFVQRSRVVAGAEVICRGTPAGFECTITNPKDAGTVNVLWDVRLQCRNGTVVRASASQIVPQDVRFVHLIPLADLNGLDQCDVGKSVVVENVRARNAR